jgi:hypothetical protein
MITKTPTPTFSGKRIYSTLPENKNRKSLPYNWKDFLKSIYISNPKNEKYLAFAVFFIALPCCIFLLLNRQFEMAGQGVGVTILFIIWAQAVLYFWEYLLGRVILHENSQIALFQRAVFWMIGLLIISRIIAIYLGYESVFNIKRSVFSSSTHFFIPFLVTSSNINLGFFFGFIVTILTTIGEYLTLGSYINISSSSASGSNLDSSINSSQSSSINYNNSNSTNSNDSTPNSNNSSTNSNNFSNDSSNSSEESRGFLRDDYSWARTIKGTLEGAAAGLTGGHTTPVGVIGGAVLGGIIGAGFAHVEQISVDELREGYEHDRTERSRPIRGESPVPQDRIV